MTRAIFAIALLMLVSGCNLERPATATPQTPLPAEPSATITLTPAGSVPNPVGVGTRAVATSTPAPTATPPPQLDLPLPSTPTDAVAAAEDPDLPPLADFIKQDNINLSVGSTLAVTYTVTLDNPGRDSVFFVLVDPSGEVVWQYIVTQTETDTAEISIANTGIHELLVYLQNAQGGFSIDGNYSVAYELR